MPPTGRPGAEFDHTITGVAHQDQARLSAVWATTPDALWSALSEPVHVAHWLGDVDGEIAAGTDFEVRHDRETRSRHRVRRWEPRRALDLSWEFPDEPPSRVAFAIIPGTNGVTLTLAHLDLSDPIGYAAGWHRHLEYLAAHLHHRDSLMTDFWSGHQALVDRYTASAR